MFLFRFLFCPSLCLGGQAALFSFGWAKISALSGGWTMVGEQAGSLQTKSVAVMMNFLDERISFLVRKPTFSPLFLCWRRSSDIGLLIEPPCGIQMQDRHRTDRLKGWEVTNLGDRPVLWERTSERARMAHSKLGIFYIILQHGESERPSSCSSSHGSFPMWHWDLRTSSIDQGRPEERRGWLSFVC